MQSLLSHVTPTPPTTTHEEGYVIKSEKKTELDFPYVQPQNEKKLDKFQNVRGSLERLPLESEYSRHNEPPQTPYEGAPECRPFNEPSGTPMVKFSPHEPKDAPPPQHNNFNSAASPKHIQEQSSQESNHSKRLSVNYRLSNSPHQQNNNRRFPLENGHPGRDFHNQLNVRRDMDHQMKEQLREQHVKDLRDPPMKEHLKEHLRRPEHIGGPGEKENEPRYEQRYESRKIESEIHYYPAHHPPNHHEGPCAMQDCCRKDSSSIFPMNEMHSSKRTSTVSKFNFFFLNF